MRPASSHLQSGLYIGSINVNGGTLKEHVDLVANNSCNFDVLEIQEHRLTIATVPPFLKLLETRLTSLVDEEGEPVLDPNTGKQVTARFAGTILLAWPEASDLNRKAWGGYCPGLLR